MSLLSGRKRLQLALLAVAVVLAAAVVVVRSSRPQSLIVLAGAENVHYGRSEGHRYVRYELKEKYPATAATKEITNRLTKQGFRPFGDEIRWTHFVDDTREPKEDVQQWLVQWASDTENPVDYVLQYRSPVGGPPNTDRLQVGAVCGR